MDPTQSLTDEAVALDACAGSRHAFEVLVRRYASAVILVIEKQVGDPHLAADLSQEVWVKVFRGLAKYRPGGSFRSWLFSIALNHVRDARRRQARSRVVYLDDFRAQLRAPASSDPQGRTEEHAAIQEAMAQVPEPYRTALLMVDVLHLSYEEAAAALATRVGTVKSRVNRGRLAFRDQYVRAEPAGSEDEKERVGAPRRGTGGSAP